MGDVTAATCPPLLLLDSDQLLHLEARFLLAQGFPWQDPETWEGLTLGYFRVP